MNASYVKTKNYEQKPMDNEPIKQTQSKPIYGEPVEPTKPISSTSAGRQRKSIVVAPGTWRKEVVRHFVGRDFGLDGHRGVNVEAAF